VGDLRKIYSPQCQCRLACRPGNPSSGSECDSLAAWAFRSWIGLLSQLADKRGFLRSNAAPSDQNICVCRSLGTRPRLSSRRAVLGDVMPERVREGRRTDPLASPAPAIETTSALYGLTVVKEGPLPTFTLAISLSTCGRLGEFGARWFVPRKHH
jgi:hypothetical protein